MNLRPNELVFGVAPEILLDCLQQIRDGERPITLDDFGKALGAPIDEAEPVLREMVAAGFFSEFPGGFERTKKFTQLAAASISHGLTRVEADALLARVVSKAADINAREHEYECRVRCVVVFGSYLTEKSVLGDLDVGVSVAELRHAGERLLPYEVRRLIERPPSARVFSELRLRKPKQISVHRLREVLELGTPYKIVFGEIPERDQNRS